MPAQTEQRNNRLVILSLPFQRLIRSHLSSVILETLTNRADVVIVSPFAQNQGFSNQYGGSGISHLSVPPQNQLPWIFRKLNAVSSFLRMRGYWCRIRKKVPYFWANRYVRYDENGNDTMPFVMNRWLMDILAWIGSWPRAWVLLDSLIGRWSYNTPELVALARSYDHVILIQAACWGFQDQSLAWMGKENKWRTVLLPYTTDQLFICGYLYSDFDAVCVQGMVERRLAQELHVVSTDRIINLGSTYFRALGAIEPVGKDKAVSPQPHKQKIMYAGIISTSFPVGIEIEAVNMLSDSRVFSDAKGLEVIYRPATFETLSEDFKESIRRKLRYPERVAIQTPSPTSMGMGTYSYTNCISDLRCLLADLSEIDVLVTSLTTSLSLEAALLGVPTIAYFPNDCAVLQKRKVGLALNSETRVIGLESVLVATGLEELASLVRKLLNNPDMRREIAEATLREWDYPESNYSLLLESAVFGKA